MRYQILIATAAAALAIMLAHPAPASAAFTVCNSTTQGTVWVADAITWHYKGDSYGESQGWWGIDQGDCKTLINNDISDYSVYIFAYAQDDTSSIWSGAKANESHYYCVDTVKFLFKGDDMDTPCSNGSSRNFRYVDTSSDSTFTYRLTD